MSVSMNPTVEAITQRIIERSRDSRREYLDLVASRKPDDFARKRLADANLAHATAGCVAMDKVQLLGGGWPNIGIITSYNDMLSAHAPYEHYPEIVRDEARKLKATAQVAGGVPAMCDGVTQGYEGMELSLFSRDVIAMASAIGLSHDMYDAALFFGVCDKIVPGLVISALRFGWLPSVFVPAGPMPSGLPNPEKARIRQLYAEGKVDRSALLEAEAKSYHAPGTCTFFGTANSNQMFMEVMGLHVPGAAFPNPGTPIREALTRAAVGHALKMTSKGETPTVVGEMIDEKSFVNAMVGLMATGGSTNHTLHLPAMAEAAGIKITWDDLEDLSGVTPLLTRIYPNGTADVNHFQAAGGMAFVIRELLDAGLMHEDVGTVAGPGLRAYAKEPFLKEDGTLEWRDAPAESGDTEVLRPVSDPFSKEGGLRVLAGPLGRGVIKVSAVKDEHRIVEAPVRVFESQAALQAAFKAGELYRDVVVVVRFQGPYANGMPELHKLTPPLSVLQDRGHKVALVTDGRMSGASGKVPAAIHVGPEAALGGPLARVQDGDIIRLDATKGSLEILVDAAEFEAREPAVYRPNESHSGMGREMFNAMRPYVTVAEAGASLFGHYRMPGQ